MLITPSRGWTRPPPAALCLVLLACGAAGCAASPSELPASGPGTLVFPRAWVMREDADLAAACEERLARSYEAPPAAGEPWLRALSGGSSVLVTAPHATAQTRDGETKSADGGTGSLAVML